MNICGDCLSAWIYIFRKETDGECQELSYPKGRSLRRTFTDLTIPAPEMSETAFTKFFLTKPA